ncbi:hypothetical protein Maq22A_c16250 [Methylobacterium aquaticum]|uniref:Uncharacterized protein n=1 Tax=Methylobacterium aquaticum TaxID=270351 RepID=A0A0C6F1C7_9HYPH|nr:hypothetical protein Maq22A_c16250 [Methylobacterium aquaticum]
MADLAAWGVAAGNGGPSRHDTGIGSQGTPNGTGSQGESSRRPAAWRHRLPRETPTLVLGARSPGKACPPS